MTPLSRLYRVVIRLYPECYRDRFGGDAVSLFDRLIHEARRRDGRVAAAWLAARYTLRALAGAVPEWAYARTHGGKGCPRSSSSSSSSSASSRSLFRMRHDLKYAIRALVGRPGFAATVILLLATGIGAATAVFSVVDGVMLRPLPYPDADRLVYLDNASHPPADFVDWQTEVASIGTWGGVWSREANLTGDERPEVVMVGRVTEELFGLLGARVSEGRLFSAGEYRPDPTVGVISHRLWVDRWGGDPDVLGRQIQLGDESVTVVGIISPDFRLPGPLERGRTSVWVPFDPTAPEVQDRGLHALRVVGRLASGATLEAARSEMDVMNRRFAERFPDSHMNRDGTYQETPVMTLREAETGDVRGTLLLLLGAVGLLLLLACVNVANLLLARGADRSRELALRGALGATRRNVLTQLTAEALFLSLAGGVVGVLLALAGVRLFELLEPGMLPRAEAIGMDLRVLGFALATSVGTGLLFGIFPALRASRLDVRGALSEGSGQATAGRRRSRVQGSLVVSEVALSLVLLVGAGLLFHSFLRLTRVQSGFEPGGLVTVDLQLGPEYEGATRARFTEELTRQLEAIPGTESVATGLTLPFQYADGGSCCWAASVYRQGAAEDEDVGTALHPVGPGFLATMGIPLLRGRDLQPGDGRLDPFPVVLDQRAATELFREREALGEIVTFSDRQGVVVGISGTVRHVGFDADGYPNLYLPTERGPEIPLLNVGIRTTQPLRTVAPAIREAVWDLDPDLPIPDIASMEERMSRSVAEERFYSAIMAAFAVIALLLAAGGVYATFLYSVRQRLREMGIRLALGAQRRDVVGLVMRRGLALTLAGVVVGLVGATLGARVLASMVFDISARDPLTYAAVSALMVTVALGACLVPALRAGRTDPMETLRAE